MRSIVGRERGREDMPGGRRKKVKKEAAEGAATGRRVEGEGQGGEEGWIPVLSLGRVCVTCCSSKGAA